MSNWVLSEPYIFLCIIDNKITMYVLQNCSAAYIFFSAVPKPINKTHQPFKYIIFGVQHFCCIFCEAKAAPTAASRGTVPLLLLPLLPLLQLQCYCYCYSTSTRVEQVGHVCTAKSNTASHHLTPCPCLRPPPLPPAPAFSSHPPLPTPPLPALTPCCYYYLFSACCRFSATISIPTRPAPFPDPPG